MERITIGAGHKTLLKHVQRKAQITQSNLLKILGTSENFVFFLLKRFDRQRYHSF